MNLLTLQHNRPLRIAGATRIECVAGTVWLTRTGGASDVFLRAGDAGAPGRAQSRVPGVERRQRLEGAGVVEEGVVVGIDQVIVVEVASGPGGGGGGEGGVREVSVWYLHMSWSPGMMVDNTYT